MNLIHCRFNGELKDLLRCDQDKHGIRCTFEGNPSIKHIIEAHGIPHTEVGKILANARQVDFTYKVQNNDTLDVFPIDSLESQNKYPKFLLDCHLGKLAVYLRLVGFDADYRNDYDDDGLARIVLEEDKILLSRDRGLLMRKAIRQGYYVRNLDPKKQLLEILERYQLYGVIKPFKRCLRCNNELQLIDKDTIIDRLQPLTQQYYDIFSICPKCDRIYWQGSHFEHMQEFLTEILR
jgi:uncharacterized protein